jgi:hypothetical protein
MMRIKVTTLLLMLFCGLLAMPASATKNGREESFSALAQLPVAGTTMNVRIYIKSYSTTQEAQQLHGVLTDGGPSALLKALSKMKPIGRIEQEGTVGFYDFKLILSKSTAEGRHIYAVTDRPIGFLEAYVGSRSVDYPFGILELDLKTDKKGKEKGEGSLIYAAQIKVVDGDKVDIENLTFAPIRLLGVQQL